MTDDHQGNAPPAGDRRRANRTRTYMPAGIMVPGDDPEPWECVVLDISANGCAVYFEEHVPAYSAVLLTLPGLDGPVIARLVSDRGEVKHFGFALKLDVGPVMRAHAARQGRKG